MKWPTGAYPGWPCLPRVPLVLHPAVVRVRPGAARVEARDEEDRRPAIPVARVVELDPETVGRVQETRGVGREMAGARLTDDAAAVPAVAARAVEAISSRRSGAKRSTNRSTKPNGVQQKSTSVVDRVRPSIRTVTASGRMNG